MEGSITVILWLVWVYFILPVFTGDGCGFSVVRLFYQKLIIEGGLEQLGDILLNGGIAILVIFILQTLWISYKLLFHIQAFRRKT